MGIFEFIIALVSIVLGVITVWMLMFHKQWFRSDEKIDPKGDYDLRELSRHGRIHEGAHRRPGVNSGCGSTQLAGAE